MFLYKINKIKVIAAIAVIMGGLTSCENFLTEVPESEITPQSFYKDNTQLESGLIAAYSRMSDAYSSNHMIWGEFRSDNLSAEFGTNEDRQSIHNSQIEETLGSLTWATIYEAIDFTNRVINEGQNIVGFDEELVGQALALRAKAYFDIARVWGDVPVFTESVEGAGDVSREKTSVNDIMQNVVIPDMLKAAEFIKTDAKEFTFTRASVFALQGEVYLWLGENQLAKNAFDNLIALGAHSLVTTPDAWQDLFLNHSTARGQEISEKRQIGPELIFSFAYLLGVGETSGVALNYAFGGDNGSSTITEDAENKWKERFPIIDTLWTQKYPNTQPVFTRTIRTQDGLRDSIVPIYGDWRLFASRQDGNFEVGLGGKASGQARVHKWQKTRNLRRGDDDTNLVIYRYADIILMLAEAELKLGNNNRSLELINEIRTARQLPLATLDQFNNDAATPLDFLLDERRFELLGEGKRWWDLLRNNKAEETLNPLLRERGKPELTSDRLVWPIFSQHLIQNTKIEQNEGWR